MSDSMERIVLDVAEDFPSGSPRKGDVIVIRPNSTQWPVSIGRHRGHDFLNELLEYSGRLSCRGKHDDTELCPVCRVRGRLRLIQGGGE